MSERPPASPVEREIQVAPMVLAPGTFQLRIEPTRNAEGTVLGIVVYFWNAALPVLQFSLPFDRLQARLFLRELQRILGESGQRRAARR